MYVVVPGGSRNKQVKSIVHNNMFLKICTVVIHRSPEVYKLEESIHENCHVLLYVWGFTMIEYSKVLMGFAVPGIETQWLAL